MLESDIFDIAELGNYLSGITSSFWAAGFKDHLESLGALHFATEIYEHLMDATIDLEVTSIPLNQFQWAPHNFVSNLSRPTAFACVATFESANLNILPSDLKDVMGISTGNSLYIAEYLWTDPYSSLSSHIIKRSIGNVGRHGLAFLISPTNTNTKQLDYSSWVNIPHEDFDGNFKGTFDKTSLHLSFTGYESSLGASEHGLFDKQVYFLQAVVQAFDAGIWVADLDIVTALDGGFGKNNLKRIPPAKQTSREISKSLTLTFTRKAEENPSQTTDNTFFGDSDDENEEQDSAFFKKSTASIGVLDSGVDGFCDHSLEESRDFSAMRKLTSLDCWDEILDSPDNSCIVRTNGDWLARLATAVYGLQKLKTVVIAPKHEVCWACIQRMMPRKAKIIVIC